MKMFHNDMFIHSSSVTALYFMVRVSEYTVVGVLPIIGYPTHIHTFSVATVQVPARFWEVGGKIPCCPTEMYAFSK